ncbi:uncharacterized protein LODBEIA_P35500 [Lodderomyces beijingensis]|uniref:Protein kinase domain-containing protein n=1 Tax=Lodderomyces beijingensis TaxID=1775926 RepID=A0ABP0ZME3_9ASCO
MIAQKSDYILAKKPIGHGTYSTVFECKNKYTGSHYAAKRYTKNLVYGLQTLLQSELEILKRVSSTHAHILSLVDQFETENCFYLVTDLAEGGDLFDRIVHHSSNGKLSEHAAKSITWQLVSATEFLHRNNIIHRDIKAENIFFQSMQSNTLLLGDFGLAKVLQEKEKLYDVSGTLSYMAPEMFDREVGYSFPIDVWAIGVCLYFMLEGYLPFDCDSDEETKDAIINKKYFSDAWETGAAASSSAAQDLILQCLKTSGSERPISLCLKTHHFLLDAGDMATPPTQATIDVDELNQIKTLLLNSTPSTHGANHHNQTIPRTLRSPLHKTQLYGDYCASPECRTEISTPLLSRQASHESSLLDLHLKVERPPGLMHNDSQQNVATIV